MESVSGDVRDAEAIASALSAGGAEIVIHMAAQPLVRESYRDPVGTIASNVMGTVHLLEALRRVPDLKAVLVVTSDKVYRNHEGGSSFSEDAVLGGDDPYSASKAAAEILVRAYARSFLQDRGIAVCTARAGNVIGGGDWSRDRIVPDLWRAWRSGAPVELRYPEAVRPWQHVLDPLQGYLAYVERMAAAAGAVPPALNFGPPPGAALTVLQLAERFAAALGADGLWTIGTPDRAMPESGHLAIDATLARDCLGWRPALDAEAAIRWSGLWYKAHARATDMIAFSQAQIAEHLALAADRPR
jgi:CDP-glucose 4,6-dehydratase